MCFRVVWPSGASTGRCAGHCATGRRRERRALWTRAAPTDVRLLGRRPCPSGRPLAADGGRSVLGCQRSTRVRQTCAAAGRRYTAPAARGNGLLSIRQPSVAPPPSPETRPRAGTPAVRPRPAAARARATARAGRAASAPVEDDPRPIDAGRLGLSLHSAGPYPARSLSGTPPGTPSIGGGRAEGAAVARVAVIDHLAESRTGLYPTPSAQAG